VCKEKAFLHFINSIQAYSVSLKEYVHVRKVLVFITYYTHTFVTF